jgi:hypothetical protein
MPTFEFNPGQDIVAPMPDHGISARFFIQMMGQHFNIGMTPELQQTTLGVCNMVRIVDDTLDDPTIENPGSFGELAGALQEGQLTGRSEADTQYARRYLESLNEEQWGFADMLYERAVSVTARRTEARTIHNYAGAVLAEADVATSALAVSTSHTLHPTDFKDRTRYNKWLKKFSRASALGDAITDLREDAELGRTRLEPTARNRLALARRLARPALQVLRSSPPRSLPLIAGMAIGYNIAPVNLSFSDDQPRKPSD